MPNEVKKNKMRAKTLILACCLLPACSLGMIASPQPALSAEENLQETIDYLVDYVRTSDVTFIRNNKEHSPEDAAKHIMKKYKHYRKKIKTPEDFIRLSATKSTMSGKAYHIRTADGVTMTSAEWLTQALEEYRQAGTAPAESFATRTTPTESGTAEASATASVAIGADVELELNLECPDSSRYEIRTIERKSGDCEDPDRDCASVKMRYPEVVETPFVDARHGLNAFILQALLVAGSEEEQKETLEDLAEGFLGKYENLRKDMPDYSTGWFLERSITVIHNTTDILSLDMSEIVYSGGAHPNSTRNYVSLDVSTGMILTLSDILMDDHMRSLKEIAEREFRRLKETPADQDLDEAGFWFEDGKFRLNDNFAIIDQGLVFYFNNYEVASYADGPTRLVIPFENLKPLVRKDRLEWFAQSQ